MKSTIFEGIAERLADIKRDEGRFVPTEGHQDIIDQAYHNLPSPTLEDAVDLLRKVKTWGFATTPTIVDPVSYCSVYGHEIGLTGFCIVCGLKP